LSARGVLVACDRVVEAGEGIVLGARVLALLTAVVSLGVNRP
jgi:hypothetical protein